MNMAAVQILTTRLRLRPFRRSDADDVARLAGDEAVARDTLNIPHPYHARDADQWIAALPGQTERREAVTFAVTTVRHDELVGAVTLILDGDGRGAELGYWIGRPHWGRGYATEAAGAVLDWGIRVLELDRIQAHHFARNAASGAVLRKLGMHHTGRLAGQVVRAGESIDVECYRVLGSDYDAP